VRFHKFRPPFSQNSRLYPTGSRRSAVIFSKAFSSPPRTCGPSAFDCSNARMSSSCSSSSTSTTTSSETSLFSGCSRRDFFTKLSRALRAIVSSTPVRPDFFRLLIEGGRAIKMMWLERNHYSSGLPMADQREIIMFFGHLTSSSSDQQADRPGR
jgi:hypothetical protein